MTVLLVVLYVIVCIFLILVVLLQQGKGADLAGAFGGAGTQTAFGPRGSTTIMHRLTTASFVLFVLLSMALAIAQGNRGASVMGDVEPVATTPVTEPGVPGAAADAPIQPGQPGVAEPVAEPVREPNGAAEPVGDTPVGEPNGAAEPPGEPQTP